MKLILSRKGFDSSAGGVPSPIFPDGKMISLPIPGEEGASNLTYQEIPGNEWASVGELVQQLKARVSSTSPAHLDPDLFAGTVLRKDGWKPLFGQVGASESHLVNQGVGEGDLFLFFGLFRRVEKSTGRWRYVVDSRPMHVIFGWLQIAKRVRVSDWPPDEDWATYHPHFQAQFRLKYSNVSNVVYVATEQLSLPGVASLSIHGAGTFSHYSRRRRLSAPECSGPSRWLLPSWFLRENQASSLSFHGRADRRHQVPGGVELTTVGRGQEFVLNCDHYPDAIQWLRALFDAPQ